MALIPLVVFVTIPIPKPVNASVKRSKHKDYQSQPVKFFQIKQKLKR